MLFSFDTLLSINIRNRLKELKKAKFIPICTNQKEHLNWHCVLNTSQLAGYSGKINRINQRLQVRKRTLAVYKESATLKHDPAIEQHLLNNPHCCASNYSGNCFKIIGKAMSFYLGVF